MRKSQAEEGQLTYLEIFQPELVVEMQNLCVLALVEEHRREEEEWASNS